MSAFSSFVRGNQQWLITSLFFFFAIFQIGLPNSLGDFLISHYGLSGRKALGEISGAYFLANFWLLLPMGLLIDLFSPKKIVLIALALSTVGVAGLGLTEDADVAYWARLLSGAGSTGAMLGTMKIAVNLDQNKENLDWISAVVVAVGMAGGIFSLFLIPIFLPLVGGLMILFGVAGIGVLFFVLIVLFVDEGSTASAGKIEWDKEIKDKIKSIRISLKNSTNWISAFYTSTLNLPIMIIAGFIGVEYLAQVHNFDKQDGSYISGMIFAGTLVGGVLVGKLGTQYGTRRIMRLMGVLSIVVGAAIPLSSNLNSLLLIFALFFLLGLATSGQVLGYTMIKRHNNKERIGTALGLASMIIMGAGWLQPHSVGLVGWLSVGRWAEDAITRDGFIYFMYVFPALFFVALLFSLSLPKDEAGDKQQNDPNPR